MLLTVNIETIGKNNFPPKDIPVHVFIPNTTVCLEELLRWDGEQWYRLVPVTVEDDTGQPTQHLVKAYVFSKEHPSIITHWCKQLDFPVRL